MVDKLPTSTGARRISKKPSTVRPFFIGVSPEKTHDFKYVCNP